MRSDGNEIVPRNGARERETGGFTLVEVAVAVVLLVVGVLALAHVTLTIRAMQRADEERALAESALLAQLRAIETTPFGDLVANFDGRGFDVMRSGATSPALRPLPGDLDGMPGAISVIAPAPPGDPTQLLEATVRIDWEGSCGPRHLVRRERISHPGANP